MQTTRVMRRMGALSVLGLTGVGLLLGATPAAAQLQPGYKILGKDLFNPANDAFVHADIGVAYIPRPGGGEWDLHIHLDPPQNGPDGVVDELAPDEALLYVGQQTRITVPAGTPANLLSALGTTAGSTIWLLPQSSPTTDTLWLGIGAEENVPADFTGGLTLSLLSLTHFNIDGTAGSGNVAFWQPGSLGGINIGMASGDGIDANDFINVAVGAHDHFNIGFSQAGFYEVTFEARGNPVDGGPTSSGPVTYYFGVETVTAPAASAAVPEAGTLALAGGVVLPLLGVVASARRRRRATRGV